MSNIVRFSPPPTLVLTPALSQPPPSPLRTSTQVGSKRSVGQPSLHQEMGGRKRQQAPAGACGGRDRRRSGDLPLFRRTLCQLSYSTECDMERVAHHIRNEAAKWQPRAVPTGLEPATSGLTGRRELQLHHGTRSSIYIQHPQRDSNPCRHLERVMS